MKHFFILGSHPALSLAELYVRLPLREVTLIDEACIAEAGELDEANRLISSLGGTVKIGTIVSTVKSSTELLAAGERILAEIPKDGKFNFGISVYGKTNLKTLPLGLELKKSLRLKDISCRFVTSKEKTLSSVVVEQNKLTRGGVELVLIANGKDIHVGVTGAVQPFKDLSHRDYGRPARDDRSGMLPPKLAQILINFCATGRDDLILDPFCGSGTVLTEAMLMGFTKIAGTDISAKAIADSEKNITWIAEQYGVMVKPEVQVADVRKLSDTFKDSNVAAIATETYLGPQRGAFDIKKTSQELSLLYSEALTQFYRVLKPGGRVAVVLPAFGRGSQRQLLPLDFGKFKIVPPLPAQYMSMSGVTPRNTLLYGRSDQNVWREIMILQK